MGEYINGNSHACRKSYAEDLKLKGDGWRLITDEEETSSPLAELEDLLKDR